MTLVDSDVAVALCSHRGTAHLSAQLDSIAAQTVSASVHVHDDASNDGTVALARAHPSAPHVVAHTANVGVVRNFERSLRAMLDSGARYVAIADQDDIWHPQRLQRGLIEMKSLQDVHGNEMPLLVHSDLRMIDASGSEIAPSFLRFRGYATSTRRDVAVMLGQCGVMGNTCLVNRALIELSLPFPEQLHVHDWWLGLLAELYGARACIEVPLIDYRIHASNASNSVESLHGRKGRGGISRLLARDFRVPFFEDRRVSVLQQLLSGDGYRPLIAGADRQIVSDFTDCLEFAQSRPATFLRLVRGGYLRRSFAHRARVAAALCTTNRYPRGRSTSDLSA